MCPALLVFYLEITIAGVTVPTLGLVNVSALDDINFTQFFETAIMMVRSSGLKAWATRPRRDLAKQEELFLSW